MTTSPTFTPIAPPKTSGLAIASLVLGILWVFWIGSIIAVVLGHVSLSQIKKAGGALTGRGMAIAGLVLGYIGVGTLAMVIAISALGADASQKFNDVDACFNGTSESVEEMSDCLSN